MKLDGQVAVVTGAASGIARALCGVLGAEGARLVLVDRNEDGLRSLSEELSEAGVQAVAATADVSDRDGLQAAIRGGAAELGPVDLLVACAGITGVTLVDDMDVELVERIVRTNYLGVVYAVSAVLPEMVARGRGQIVGVSSLAGCRGMPFSAAYSASKAAVSTYLESLRPSLRRSGVAVTTVLPGFVRTPLMENAPLKPPMRMLEPEEAARYVLRAILRRKRSYCFPWGVSLGVRALKWLPAGVYDRTMSRAAQKIPSLTY